MDLLIELSNKRLQNTSDLFKRYMIDEIDWSDRLISIVGGRGAGKTTMMLQNLKETYDLGSKALYVSLDNIYFSKNLLSELADRFVKLGGVALYVDEVHKYPNWSIELKNIYDNYPELKVVFSGSSMLELYKGHGDLSRRLSSYSLPPLSFREFIELEHDVHFPKVTLNELLSNHIEIAHSVTAKIKPLAFFNEYLNFGAFPFFKESRSKYHERMLNVVNMILDYDLPSITPIDYAHVLKMKMLLKIISELVPYTPNISKLASQTEIDRKTVLKYLDLLHRGGLIYMLNTPETSDSVFTKPQKIYLGNPNFMFSLCDENPNIGTLRETFFCQQLSVKHKVHVSTKSDFLIDKHFTFEVGGKNKNAKQITGIPDSYIATDGIEYGYANHIPLWLFGLLY
jgi:predicted AAA+ superfamily ATPase